MREEVEKNNGAELYFLRPSATAYPIFPRRFETTSTSNRMEHPPTVPEQQCNTSRRKVFFPTSSRGLQVLQMQTQSRNSGI
jgi:hypothetical protein